MNKIIFKKGSNQYKKRSKSPRARAYMAAATAGVIAAYLAVPYVAGFLNDFVPSAYAPTNTTAYAEKIAGGSAQVKPVGKFGNNERANKLYGYLTEHNSPLADYADFIVSEADKNDIPWTLIVSISGKESTFGRAIKPSSHNAWGIMAWDTEGNRFIRSFPNWKVAITFESELLGNNFKRDMNAGIQQRYCPSFECSTSWVTDVTRFSKEIKE